MVGDDSSEESQRLAGDVAICGDNKWRESDSCVSLTAGIGADARGMGTDGVSVMFIAGADNERERLGEPGVKEDEPGGSKGELGAVGELATALDFIGGPQNQSTDVSKPGTGRGPVGRTIQHCTPAFLSRSRGLLTSCRCRGHGRNIPRCLLGLVVLGR